MVEISNSGIGPDDLVARETIQVDFAAGIQASSGAAKKVVLMGNKLDSASGTDEVLYGPDTATPLRSLADFDTLFGARSELRHMAAAFFLTGNTSSPLYAIAQPEATGANASGTIEFSGTATKNGTVEVRLMNEIFRVGFATEDGYQDVATSVASKINEKSLPMTAVATLGDVVITFSHPGTRGNEVRFSARVVEASTGITVTPNSSTQFSGGTGDDDNEDALAALEGTRFHYFVSAASDATNLGRLKSHIENEALPTAGHRGRFFAGSAASLGTVNALATGLNATRGEIVWQCESDYIHAFLAAHWVACVAHEQTGLGSNPRAINLCRYGTKPSDVWKLRSPATGYKPTRAELKSALSNGVSPVEALSGGRSCVNRSVTTYSLNGSDADLRVKDSGIITVCDEFADILQTRVGQQCTGKILADDAPEGKSLVAGAISPQLVASTVYGLLEEFAKKNLIRNLDESKAQVIVSLSEVPGRLGIAVPLWPANIYAQGVMLVSQMS